MMFKGKSQLLTFLGASLLISLILTIPVAADPDQVYGQGLQDGFQGETYSPLGGHDTRGYYTSGYEAGKRN